MSVYKQEDGHGHSMTLLNTDGFTSPSFFDPEGTANRIREMVNFRCRPDDVFICAPVKSGTHWTWEIISMMYQGTADTITRSKISYMIEASPWDLVEKLPSPRILNTHMPYSRMPKQVNEFGCKMVYVLRNPKDLAVSLYNHALDINAFEYTGIWEHFLPLFLEGKVEYNSWFEYVLEWEEAVSRSPDQAIHLIYYEDLKENTLQEVNKLGKFLGIDNKDGLFEAISEKCQFHNMAKDKQQFLSPGGFSLGDGFSFYRKGIIGDWKNWFTVAQNEMFDKIYNERMKHSKHTFRYDTRRKLN